MSLFSILLFLHVLGAIVAFGPGYAAMVVGPMVAREPQHAGFFARTQLATSKKLVTPVALSMAVTGGLMIVDRGWSTITGGTYWLHAAIALYVVAIVFAFGFQAPAGSRLVELTSAPPAPGSPPNPEVPATAGRVRLGGMVLTLLTAVILFLMVTKPF